MVRQKITPATQRVFGGKRYYILTRVIPKYQAVPIAKSYRTNVFLARVVQVAGGYVVYVRSVK